MYEDKVLKCRDCGEEFVFTAGEQEFYAEKGFQNEPQRCKSCREQERTAEKRRESTLQPYALIAEKRLRFPLNPQTTDLFTAASVTRQESSN